MWVCVALQSITEITLAWESALRQETAIYHLLTAFHWIHKHSRYTGKSRWQHISTLHFGVHGNKQVVWKQMTSLDRLLHILCTTVSAVKTHSRWGSCFLGMDMEGEAARWHQHWNYCQQNMTCQVLGGEVEMTQQSRSQDMVHMSVHTAAELQLWTREIVNSAQCS